MYFRVLLKQILA